LTLKIFDQVLEAEQIAEPEDFNIEEYDMGVPVGYNQQLYAIWLRKKA
jgi:hypothetical protein